MNGILWDAICLGGISVSFLGGMPQEGVPVLFSLVEFSRWNFLGGVAQERFSRLEFHSYFFLG